MNKIFIILFLLIGSTLFAENIIGEWNVNFEREERIVSFTINFLDDNTYYAEHNIQGESAPSIKEGSWELNGSKLILDDEFTFVYIEEEEKIFITDEINKRNVIWAEKND